MALTLTTGSGFWNPVVWLIAITVIVFVVYLLWRRGESGYTAGSAQVKPFISGNPEPATKTAQMPASNLYWGFTEALSGYYSRVVPAHTGIVTDYLLWVLWVTAVLFILVVIT
jgi:hypothetical protein